MHEVLKPDCSASAMVAASAGLSTGITFKNTYRVECHDADGNLKWTEETENLVTTQGATDLLDKYFKGSAYTAAWFVGIYGGTGTLAAADTMASHAGWTEVTAYTGTRPALTLGTASAGSVDNNASKAVFTMNGTATVLGAFVANHTSSNAGTVILFGETAFSASRSVVATDTLTVGITLTAS